MSIKRRIDGYRNRENFKTAIFFHCGELDLYHRESRMGCSFAVAELAKKIMSNDLAQL